MSLLLAFPAVAVILYQALGLKRTMTVGFLMAQLQFTLGMPFLPANPIGYLSRAFEFTRQFLFKWTVNWRFVGEEVFLSKEFTIGLLNLHAALLLVFLATRWIRPTGVSFHDFLSKLFHFRPAELQRPISNRITPSFVMSTMLTTVAIGMLCARSLHYQFFAYLAWATPFLLWKAGFHPVFIYALWAAQEWAWNVYPSTDASSMVVVGLLAVQVLGAWWGSRNDFVEEGSKGKSQAQQKAHAE